MNEKDQDDPSLLLGTVRRLRAARALPPAPFHEEYLRTVTPLSVMHWQWRQDVHSFDAPSTAFEPVRVVPDDIARSVADMPNVLTSLADALYRMAGECRGHGLVPVGINVASTHPDWSDDMESYVSNQRRPRAHVNISISAVPFDWVGKAVRAKSAEAMSTAPAELANSDREGSASER